MLIADPEKHLKTLLQSVPAITPEMEVAAVHAIAELATHQDRQNSILRFRTECDDHAGSC